MICPYTVHRVETSSIKIKYDEDGKEAGHERVTASYAEPIACKEKDCGAWQDEKCCYGRIT